MKVISILPKLKTATALFKKDAPSRGIVNAAREVWMALKHMPSNPVPVMKRSSWL